MTSCWRKTAVYKFCVADMLKFVCSLLQMFSLYFLFVCSSDLILYVPSTFFQLNRDRSSWVEPNVGHFGYGHFSLGRLGPDISATDVSATENAKGGRFGQIINFGSRCVHA